MRKVGVAILGLGVVGGGTYRILTENKQYFKDNKNIFVGGSSAGGYISMMNLSP